MKKSGLVAAGLAFIFSLGASTIVSPLCVPCLVVLIGLLGGYLAGAFDKPADQNRATKAGALAGLIGGLGALLGQVSGSVVNGLLVGPEGTARMLVRMGFPTGEPAQIAQYYWTTLALSTTCLVLFNLTLMAGFGALGGILWWNLRGSKQNASFVDPGTA